MSEYKYDIENLDYSQLVSIVKERNRPSGGIKTVHEVAVNAFIDASKKMLEIGSNTGFTSVNMSLLTRCSVLGVDINEGSVKEAMEYAERNGVGNKVKFQIASAIDLPFDDNTFDVVWSSNVTSFVEDKDSATREYLRVLKPGGILVVVPIYYYRDPPIEIVDKVSEAIGAKVHIWDKKFWIDQVENVALKSQNYVELIYESSHQYNDRRDDVDAYVNEIFNKKHLKNFLDVEKEKLKEKYSNHIRLFNDNLQYAQYSILLFQKRNEIDELELFTTKQSNC